MNIWGSNDVETLRFIEGESMIYASNDQLECVTEGLAEGAIQIDPEFNDYRAEPSANHDKDEDDSHQTKGGSSYQSKPSPKRKFKEKSKQSDDTSNSSEKRTKRTKRTRSSAPKSTAFVEPFDVSYLLGYLCIDLKQKQTNSYDIYKCIDENLIDVLAECNLESTVYGGIGIEMIADGDAGDDAQATSDIVSLAVSTEPKQREQGEQQPVNSEYSI